MRIQAETAAMAGAIRALHRAAFPSAVEAEIVDRLRAAGDLALSLVALEEGAPIGHVAFSPMTAPFPALGLGPLAVAAAHRGRGVGAALVRAGLARAAEIGAAGVFVLGAPAYYGRFGFTAAEAAGFASPYAGPYLMVVALSPLGLPATTGRIDYAAAFSDLD